MIHYADTSFLCAFYREQDNSRRADAFRETMTEPLRFSSLLEFEFLQAIELQVWLHEGDRTRGYGRREADQMVSDWEADVAAGVNVLVACEMEAVLRLARVYSNQHTRAGGHRTVDILHVATAVHLRAERFLSFDIRQRRLAGMVGLVVVPLE